MARNLRGEPVKPLDWNAVSWSLEGAVRQAAEWHRNSQKSALHPDRRDCGSVNLSRALISSQRVLGVPLVAFNDRDHTTYFDVLDLIDRAIGKFDPATHSRKTVTRSTWC